MYGTGSGYGYGSAGYPFRANPGRFARVSGPASEPVTLDEAKLHLRVDWDDDDTLIAVLIQAARERCEVELDRSFINTTWDYSIDSFPYLTSDAVSLQWVPGAVRIPKARVASVTSVKYVDLNGTVQTLAQGTDYLVQTGDPGAVYPFPYVAWPVARQQFGAVTVRFVAGYGATASDVPASIKSAILLLVGHLYENREAVSIDIGQTVQELPLGVQYLLASERWGGAY